MKIMIEKARYEKFCADFKNGKYGSQRFGQAFHNEFKLEKTSINTHNIWDKDDNHAKKSSPEFVEFR